MTNPTRLELPDLINLKKQASFLAIPKKKKWADSGFGESRSLFKSKGLNFQEVRQYQPGDDIRQIDWRVTAKYGKPFTKLYEEEKERQVYILCDLRKPMHFAGQGHFKSVMAGRLSALCGFLAENKNDSLACQILSDKVISIPSGNAKDVLPYFLNQLTETVASTNGTPFSSIFPFITQTVKPGSILFFFSDFHDTKTTDMEFLGRLTHKNTLSFIHLYDSLEANIPEGVFPCSDGTETILINTESKNFKTSFQQSWEEKSNFLRKSIQKYGMGYLSLRTDSDYLNQFKHFCLGE